MKKTALLISALALTSCLAEPIYNTVHPSKGTTVLNINWNNLHRDQSIPTHLALFAGRDAYVIDDITLPIFVEPQAQQTFLMHNIPDGISLMDDIATLSQHSSESQESGSEPQSLYYALTTMDITADELHVLDLTSKRGNAMLTLKLGYEQGDLDMISNITATLSGIAATRNLRTDEISNEVTLSRYPDLGTASTIELKFNIFGTLGTEQILTLTFTTTDGRTKSITSDLSSELANFNTNMNALTFTGKLDLSVELEVEGSITDWNEKLEGSGTAS